MSLGDFLGDESGGSSWADEMADLPTAPAASIAPREERSSGFSRGFGDRYGGDDSREDGFSRGPRRDDDRPRFASRPPAELPTEPPFTAHIANLSFDAVEDDLADFFKDMKIANIRVLRDRETDRPKGYGYIEFEDQESLKSALTLSGEPLANRPIRVNIADPRKNLNSIPKERTDRVPDRTETSSWRRTTPLEPSSQSREPRRGYGFGGDREGPRGGFRDREQGGDRERGFNDRGRDTSWSGGAFSKRGNFGNRDAPSERPRLQLQPRSSTGGGASQTSEAPRSNKSNPFGAAKPIDSDEALKRLEEKRKPKEQGEQDN
ncbi:unnamed protein product [Umbelopsis sp. WA50703]